MFILGFPFHLNFFKGSSLSNLEYVNGFAGSRAGFFHAVEGETLMIQAVLRHPNLQRSPLGETISFTIDIPKAAANDDVADALELKLGGGSSHNGETYGAGAEPGEPDIEGLPARHSVWFSYTAAESSRVLIYTSSYLHRVSVFHGSLPISAWNGGDFAERVNGRYGVAHVFDAIIGETYFIALDGDDYSEYNIRLDHGGPLNPLPPPNDDFSDAIPLTGASASETVAIAGSTIEVGEPHSGSGSAWWVWTAPADGLVEIRSTGSPAFVSVYTGETLEGLVEIPSYSRFSTRFQATAGKRYFIAAWESSYPATPRSMGFTLTQGAPGPINDRIEDATELTGWDVQAAMSLHGATLDIEEPLTSGYDRNIWYRWTAPADGNLKLSIESYDFPRNIAVYSEDEAGSLVPFVDRVNLGSSFRVKLGQQYWISVRSDYYDMAEEETYFLNLHGFPSGANDSFSNSMVLPSVNEVEVVDSLHGSSLEPGEPDLEEFIETQSRWWTWTAPSDTRMMIKLSQQNGKPAIAVYEGMDVGQLTPVTSSTRIRRYGSWRQYVWWDAKEGVDYRIAVSGNVEEDQNGEFNFLLSPINSPNDFFENRLELPSSLPLSTLVQVDGMGTEPGGSSQPDAWWDWQSPIDGWVDLSCSSSSTGLSPQVFISEPDTLLTPIATQVGKDVVRFQASAGMTYHIALSPSYDYVPSGQARLSIEESIFAINDRFADAIEVVGTSAQLTGTLRGATREDLEPKPEVPGRVYDDTRTIWWKWVAPRSGALSFEFGTGAKWVHLYEGDRLEDLQPVPTVNRNPFLNPPSYRVQAGHQYWVKAGDDDGAKVTFSFFLSPEGDFFDSPLRVGGPSVNLSLNLAHATREDEDPFLSAELSFDIERSLWVCWTAPFDGELRSGMISGSQDGDGVDAYTGPSLTRLSLIPSVSKNLSFPVSAGEVYYFKVFSQSDLRERSLGRSLSFSLGSHRYAAWWGDHFAQNPASSGPDEDADGDGRTNALELAMGSDPLVFDRGPHMTFDDQGEGLQLTVLQKPGLSGWRQDFEISEDLVTWVRASSLSPIWQLIDDAGTTRLRATLPDYKMTTHPRMYFRPIVEEGTSFIVK